MSRAEEVILTNMCLIEDEAGRVVMQYRHPKRYAWSGLAFPGGHIEPGESMHAAVVREIFEETGLTIANPKLVGLKHFHTRVDGTRYLVFLYRTKAFSGQLRSSDEGEVLWVNQADLLNGNLDLAESMEDLVAFYLKETGSELYYERDDQDVLQKIIW
ncbi:8-oxo-dGTP diphosphatase [Streptococcus cuniculipharyngis]|uniref:8-oxo-dGTP diphosphatase n=1 Tax=Streptococcus cuniculipharyngis TaxID=1562651 RepID=A0A5C5SH13_9STRE|nr:8-oxo-dGTP diphosphatase [Streptococcus cuniculipharyngis]TWS99235.1 8-oxo-dGTP diphosphatase [Streptococcus cuniculipharyngis]